MLIDFGVMRRTELSTGMRLTQDGVVPGTLTYIAPELLYGNAPTPQSDQFSLAMTLLDTLAQPDYRRRPQSQEAAISALLTGRYWTAAEEALDAKDPVSAVILRALSPDFSRRFTSAREMRLALQAAARRAPAPATDAHADEPTERIGPSGSGEVQPPRGPSKPPPRAHRSGSPGPGDPRRGRFMPRAAVATALAGLLLVSVVVLAAGWPGLRVPPENLPGSWAEIAPEVQRARVWPGVLLLRTWSLEDSIHIHVATAARAKLTARLQRAGTRDLLQLPPPPGPPAHIHRLVARQLQPASTYHITLSAEGDAGATKIPSLRVRTSHAGHRASHVEAFQTTVDVKDGIMIRRFSMLARAGDDGDAEPLLAADPPRAESPAYWLYTLRFLRRLADPRHVPWIRAMVGQVARSSMSHQDRLLDAIHAIEATGGPEAAALLTELATSNRYEGSPPIRGGGDAQLAACRGLALVDPEGAARTFLEMAKSESSSYFALFGSAFLGGNRAEPLLSRAASTGAAPCQGPSWRGLLAASIALGGEAGARCLARMLACPDLDFEDRLRAIEALGTWATPAELPALEKEVRTALGLVARGGHEAHATGLLHGVTAIHALGALGARSGDRLPRPAIMALLVEAAAAKDASTSAAAFAAVARLGVPPPAAPLETVIAGLASAPPEAALALARARSSLLLPELRKVLGSGKPTNLWLASVAGLGLPGPQRDQLEALIEARVRDLRRVSLREAMVTARRELVPLMTEKKAQLVFPASAWVPTGLVLRAGDRFRLHARGFVCRHTMRRDGSYEWASPVETVLDVTTPDGLDTQGVESSNAQLIARVGRQRILSPIDPGALQIAQDDGPLLVRMEFTDSGEAWSLGVGGLIARRAALAYSGFYVVAATREQE